MLEGACIVSTLTGCQASTVPCTQMLTASWMTEDCAGAGSAGHLRLGGIRHATHRAAKSGRLALGLHQGRRWVGQCAARVVFAPTAASLICVQSCVSARARKAS